MRVINIIIVNIKYQDAVISCFLFEVKTYWIFFFTKQSWEKKKLPSILYSFSYWRSSVEFGWLTHIFLLDDIPAQIRKAENRLDKKRSYQRQVTSIWGL